MGILWLLVFVFPIVVLVEFILYFGGIESKIPNWLSKISKITILIVAPLLFILTEDVGLELDCCIENIIFSPNHRITAYIIIVLCLIGFFISEFHKSILPPLTEILINSLLIGGLLFNIILIKHLFPIELSIIYVFSGCLPIIMLFIIQLAKRHRLLRQYLLETNFENGALLSKLAIKILQSNPIYKYSFLTLLLLPILVLVTLVLMLFGQKPDSVITVFTDTYKLGFSQLDHECANVECGGHFLCSVGANGHKVIVRPYRYGIRNDNKIICTRQLLISNAFEELVQENLPKTHMYIRTNYNRVGSFVHKYYHFFNVKLVSDIVYYLIKPLEWFFLMCLYLCDEKPENRIAVQYLPAKEKNIILDKLQN